MIDARILLVDDDPDVLAAGRMLLKRSFSSVETLDAPEGIAAAIAGTAPEVILLDMNFGPGRSSGTEGLDWIARIRAQAPASVVIAITAHGGVAVAVEAMKRGATDFIAKPWQNEKLLATVSAAAELARSQRETTVLRERAATLAADSARAAQPILGSSAAMRAVMTTVERAAPTDANVLILGENGTGKELVARALHRGSTRAGEIFMSVDLGAIPETLFESELFGHRRGAFTDARSDRVGRLEAASGGTLFLDEIGNLLPHLQAKLLGALEERQMTPIGATRPVPFDVRIIAATNMPAERLSDSSVFRTDLLFRLNTITITLPALRERGDDIVELVSHYIALYERKYTKPSRPVAPAAMAALADWPWPGNVRALRHACERAVILATRGAYEAADFSLPLPDGSTRGAARAGGDLNLDRLERATVRAALERHGYNISHAARALGLTRAALYRRMEKHGL